MGEGYCAAALAAMYAAWIDTFALTQIAITISYVFMLAFAGLLVNIGTIVPWLRWLQYVSIPRFGLIGLSAIEFNGQNITCPLSTTSSNFDISGGTTPAPTILAAKDGKEWIEETLDNHVEYKDYWISIGALSGYTLVYFALGFWFLTRVKTHT